MWMHTEIKRKRAVMMAVKTNVQRNCLTYVHLKSDIVIDSASEQ